MRAMIALGCLLALAACSTTEVRTEAPAQSAQPSTTQTGEATSGQPLPAGGGAAVGATPPPDEGMMLITFAPGSDVLSPQAMTLLKSVATRLRDDRQRMVVIRGFAARQGSKEYAVAIAERRVQAVEQALARLKVSGSQVRCRNLGTEVPCGGSQCSPPARVELVFRKKAYP